MLSLMTEADDDDESSDEDETFAQKVARHAKELEETRKDANFFNDGDGDDSDDDNVSGSLLVSVRSTSPHLT